MKKRPRISIVSTSLSNQSRSRIAAHYLVARMKKLGAAVDWIDLHDNPLKSYPLSADDKHLDTLCRRIHSSDALILAFPIYNYSESGQTREFFAYVLDKEKMRNKVCLLIAGCSTKASFLAPLSVSKTLQAEIGAVVIGCGILACGDDVNRESGVISSELKKRLDHGAKLVYRFSLA